MLNIHIYIIDKTRFKACTALFLCTLLLMACSCNDVAENPGTPVLSDMPIVFNTIIEGTRAQDFITESNATLYNIGIFASWQQNGKNFADVTTHSYDFLSNGRGWYESNAWDYEPRRYWPQNGKVSFFAYMPYNSECIDKIETTDGLSITFTPKTNAGQQTELLIATPVYDRGPYTDPANADAVTFAFQHALTQIKFWAAYYYNDASSGSDDDVLHFNPKIHSIHVDYIRIKGVVGSESVKPSSSSPYCEWSAAEGVTANTTYTVGLQSDGTTLDDAQMNTADLHRVESTTIADNFMNADSTLEVAAGAGRLLVLPQNLPKTASIDIGYSFRAKSQSTTTESSLAQFEVNVPLNGTDENATNLRTWTAGKTKNYCFIINASEASVVTLVGKDTDNNNVDKYNNGGNNGQGVIVE